jgi:hypothetical protein
MARTAVFLFLCSALFASGLHRLQSSSKQHRHHPAPPNHTSIDTTHRVDSFFKLAHSRVTLESDIRATAAGLAPLFADLCASVRDCDAAVMELLADRRTELRMASDRIDRLHLVLNRVRRLVHEDDGKKRGPSHRGLKRRKEREA